MNINDLLDQLEAESTGMSKEAGNKTTAAEDTTDAASDLENALTKEASAEEKGRAAAVELLNKIAEASKAEPTKEEYDMNKQAETLADKIAEKIMEKFADTPDVTDTNNRANTVPGVGKENKINEDNRAMLAQHTDRVRPTPGTDGATQGGNVNQILDAIVDDALAMGGGTYDQMAVNKARPSATIANDDGKDPAIKDIHKTLQSGGVVKEAEEDQDFESIEKLAAVSSLIEAGVDFETATDLVKEAAEEIEAEEFEMLKVAAFDELLEEGYAFQDAAEMVKDAAKASMISKAVKAGKGALDSAKKSGKKLVRKGGKMVDKAKGYASDVAADAKDVPTLTKTLATGKSKEMGSTPKSMQRGTAFEALKKNKAVRIGAGTAAVGAAGYGVHKATEKRAALQELVDNGIDFETASDLVIEKAAEIYGDEE